MSRTADPDGRRVFRSPVAIIVWWLWVAFAVANLIDLIVAGRDHVSVVAAFSLLAVTGVIYAIAQRPRLVADADGLTIVNPVRVHHLGWPAVTALDTTDLLRVRCAWPRDPAEPVPAGAADLGPAGATEPVLAKRSIYAWAVRSSRRGQIAAEAKAKRQAAARTRGRGSSRIGLGFAAPPPDNAPPPAPLGLDAAKVIVELTDRAEKARAAAPDAAAVPPRSQWHWPSVAAIIVPAVALLIVVLA